MSATREVLERTAVHEAGHALLSLLRGYTPTRVLVRDDGSGVNEPNLDVETIGLEHTIEVLVAGWMAEKVVFGRKWTDARHDCASDDEHAQQLTRGWSNRSGLSVPAERVRLEQKVHDELRANGRVLLAFARELYRQRELDGDELRRIARAMGAVLPPVRVARAMPAPSDTPTAPEPVRAADPAPAPPPSDRDTLLRSLDAIARRYEAEDDDVELRARVRVGDALPASGDGEPWRRCATSGCTTQMRYGDMAVCSYCRIDRRAA